MSQPKTIRFDGWQLDPEVGELIRGEDRARLQDQPLQVLNELLARPGELVTREQLIARLWPKGVVDYDTGINSAVRKLRVALKDTGETPRYIETVPRKGYRFVGKIDPPGIPGEIPAPLTPPVEPLPEIAEPAVIEPGNVPRIEVAPVKSRRHTYLYMGAALVAVAIATFMFVRREDTAPVVDAVPAIAKPADANRTLLVLPPKSTSESEESELLSSSVLGLLRDRVAQFPDFTVISNNSAMNVGTFTRDPREAGRRVKAGFVLSGDISRQGDQLSLALELLDVGSGSTRWEGKFERPVTALSELREEIVAQLAREFRIKAPAPAVLPVNLPAYQLYIRGQRLMTNMRTEDAEEAVALFARATALDPSFARAYVASGQAIVLAERLKGPGSPEGFERARTRIERALELDPSLGEGWIELARLTDEPKRSDEFYRKGLALSPNYGIGFMRYAETLFSEGRLGEAILMIDRARRIDPLTPQLSARKAFFLLVEKSDVAGHDALMREALEINPDQPMALVRLGASRALWSGEFAEAANLLERAIKVDPLSEVARDYAIMVYLDLDDVAAAEHLVREFGRPLEGEVFIAQYRRDRDRAAKLAYSFEEHGSWSSDNALSGVVDAMRDGSVKSGDYTIPLAVLESKYAVAEGTVMQRRGLAIVYADTLKRSGDVERGARVARNLIVTLDAEEVSRPRHWFARERAALYAVLGEDSKAIGLLEEAQHMKQLSRWWYTGPLDPLFEKTRRDPRFIALDEAAREHRAAQRVLLEKMRQSGAVPRRN